jgi:hypothetical protein
MNFCFDDDTASRGGGPPASRMPEAFNQGDCEPGRRAPGEPNAGGIR